jgi:cysteine-rich repeat protein
MTNGSALRSLLIVLAVAPGCMDPDPSIGDAQLADTAEDRIRAAQARTDPTVIDKVQILDSMTGRPLAGDALRDARDEVRRLYNQFCRDDFFPDPTFNMPSRVGFAHDTVAYSIGPATVTPYIGVVADFDNNAFEDLIGVYENDDDIRVTPGRVDNPGTEIYKHTLPPPPGPGQAPEPGIWKGPDAPSGAWTSTHGAFKVKNGNRNLNKGDFANRGSELTALSLWGPEVRGPSWPAGKTMLLGVNKNQDVVAYEIKQNGANWEAVNRKVWTADHAGRNFDNKAYKRAFPVFTGANQVELLIMIDVVDSSTRTPAKNDRLRFVMGKARLSWNSDTVRFEPWYIEGFQFLSLVNDIAIEYDFSPPTDERAPRNHLGAVQYLVTFQYNNGFVEIARGKVVGGGAPQVTDVFGDNRFQFGYLPARDLNLAIAHNFDYQEEVQRSRRKSQNTYLFTIGDRSWYTASQPLSTPVAHEQRIANGRLVPVGGRENALTPGAWEYRAKRGTFTYAGDFGGRRVHVEPVRVDDRNYVFPTEASWRPHLLVMPPPHWVALQDWGSASYGERRGNERGETTIYENQSQRGSGWTIGGSVGTSPFGITGGYSRDRDDTQFESTSVQTDHTRSMDVGWTAEENYRPMLIVDYLCSDDHWFTVRRGTVRARQGNEVVRTALADSRQYMVVTVPRRSRDFFDDPSRCSPQDRQHCGVTPIHRAVVDVDQFRTHAYRVGQSWMDLQFDRPLTVPWTYPQHGDQRKFFNIAGAELPEAEVFHYTAALQAAQFGSVSLDINKTIQNTVNRQQLKGTSWTVSQRVEGTLSFPIPYIPFSQVSINGGYNWHEGGSNTNGRGTSLGRHETTSLQARISGFRRFALRQDYTDDNEYSISNPIDTFHQRWAYRHILGFDWGEVFRVRSGGQTANVQYWSEGSLAKGETDNDDRVIEPGRLKWEQDTVEELMKTVHYKVWPFVYSYRHERAWQRQVGGENKNFRSQLDFQVADFLVDFFNDKDRFPAGFHRGRVPFPRRKNVLFNGPRQGGAPDSFCDYMGNRVLEVVKVYDQAGLPAGTQPWQGRQAIFQLKPGGDCWSESKRGGPKVCRETHGAASTTAACVPKDPNAGDTPNEQNRPPREKEDRLSCETTPDSPSGLLPQGPPQCDGRIVRHWVQVSAGDQRGVYEPFQSCRDQCVQSGENAFCDDTFDFPVDPGNQDPGGPPLRPFCPLQRDSACATDAWCCAPAGQPWWSPLQWDALCASMTDGLCAEPGPRCGDSRIDRFAGETCDDGNRRGGDGCSGNCQDELPSRCGDGIRQAAEQCDDGNSSSGDECSSNCRVEATCGNGVQEGDEVCDDGNSDDNDGCRRDCMATPGAPSPPAGEPKAPVCGDGVPDLGEQCDDATDPNCHGCVRDGVCGDGIRQGMEQCDDGNASSSDGCAGCLYNPLLTVIEQGDGQGSLAVSTAGSQVCSGTCSVRIADLAEITISAASGTSRPYVYAFGPHPAACQDRTDASAFRVQCTIPASSLDRAVLVWWSLVEESERPAPECGDGQLDESLEECDDGNTDENDGCSSWCEIEACDPECGNGLVDEGEECDDGNAVNGDGCSYLCLDESIPPSCGDGYVDTAAGEECDDGNTDENDGCAACQYERCGDGWVQEHEQCDDGNSEDGDGCSASCYEEYCGDGVTQTGEECDDGNSADEDGCSAGCYQEYCGDGVVQSSEDCDDGNDDEFDGCTPWCTEPECGDGEVEGWEECDDGNTVTDDGCDGECYVEYCGDGVVQFDEWCDDGNAAYGDGCTPGCELESVLACGDGTVQWWEECDDGNSAPNDGCSPTCRTERCGDGIVQPDEECDPGTGDPSCSRSCRRCGEAGACGPDAGPGNPDAGPGNPDAGPPPYDDAGTSPDIDAAPPPYQDAGPPPPVDAAPPVRDAGPIRRFDGGLRRG